MSRISQFEQRLTQADLEDDPLEVYLQYISYLQGMDPKRVVQGKNPSELLAQLLHKCTQEFKKVDRYRQDVRYLKCWVKFIEHIDVPDDVYKYLFDRGIGSKLALLYESYAQYQVSQGNRSKAIRILEAGIKAQAHPLERLRQHQLLGGHPAIKIAKQSVDAKKKRDERYGFDVQALRVDGLNVSFEEIRAQQYFRQKEQTKTQVTYVPQSQKYCSDDDDDDYDDFQGTQTNISRMTNLGENEIDQTCTIVSQADLPVQRNLFQVQMDVYQDPEPEPEPVVRNAVVQKSKINRKLSFAGLVLQPSNTVYEDEFQSPLKQPSHDTSQTSPDAPQEDEQSSPFSDEPELRSKLSSLKVEQEEQELYVQSDAVGRKSLVNVMTPIVEVSECNTTLSNRSNYRSSSSSGVKQQNVLSSLYRNNSLLSVVPEADSVTLGLQPKPRESFHVPDYASCDTLNVTKVTVGQMFANELNLDTTSNTRKVYEWPDKQVVAQLIKSQIDGPWSQNQMFHNMSGQTFNKSLTLKKCMQGTLPQQQRFVLGAGEYFLQRKLGDGAYGVVYLARCKDEDTNSELNVAMKVHVPSCAWEFYIMTELQQRLDNLNQKQQFAQVQDFYLYLDESFLVMDYLNRGTLLDVVNKVRTQQGSVDDLIVMFYTVQIINIVEQLYTADIIHGDIKCDNFMVRNGKSTYQYDALGGNGWSEQGLMVIDFGQSVDVKLTGPSALFKCTWSGSKSCNIFEDRLRFPWNFNIDYIGLAGCVYVMLFGKYCELPGAVKKLQFDTEAYWEHLRIQNYKRQYKEIWIKLFEAAVNPNSLDCGSQLDSLSQCKVQMQAILTENGPKLKSLLDKL